jgi:hypothetical protein
MSSILIASGQSKLTRVSGEQIEAMVSARAVIPQNNAQRAVFRGTSGSSTTANSIRSGCGTQTKAPALSFSAQRQVSLKLLPSLSEITNLYGGGKLSNRIV